MTVANQFNLKTGKDIWEQLAKGGHLNSTGGTYEIPKGELGVAVCCQAPAPPTEKIVMIFCLTWDQPEIKFPGKSAIFKRLLFRILNIVWLQYSRSVKV